MHLLFNTGLRVGELLALQWEEVEIIDDERGYVHVNGSMGLTEFGVRRKATKNASSVRRVPFCNKYLVHLLQEAKKCSQTVWVVSNKEGSGPMQKHNFMNRYFRDVGKKLNFDHPMSSHVVRHTYISNLVAQGIPVTTIATFAGHTNPEMIMTVYAHAIRDDEKEFAYAALAQPAQGDYLSQ